MDWLYRARRVSSVLSRSVRRWRVIELIDMGNCVLFGSGVRRHGFHNFGEAIASAHRLIKIGSLSSDHVAIKRRGGRLIVVFSEVGEQRVVSAARAFGGSFVTFVVCEGGTVQERWYYLNAETGEVTVDGPVWWDSIAETKIDATLSVTLLELHQL